MRDYEGVLTVLVIIILMLSGVVIIRSAMADDMSDCKEMCGRQGVKRFVARVRMPTNQADFPELCECFEVAK
jgi:hypothetical protein